MNYRFDVVCTPRQPTRKLRALSPEFQSTNDAGRWPPGSTNGIFIPLKKD
jgi:hypothetical protein